MFLPKQILYEKNVENYELGRELLEKYKDIPKMIIENHNNIPEMRGKQNCEFVDMKKNLIIGIRKTHKFVPNHKTSDFLVPYTSSTWMWILLAVIAIVIIALVVYYGGQKNSSNFYDDSNSNNR